MTIASGQPSTISDTTKLWITRSEALNVLAKAQKTDLLQQKVDLLNADISLLNQRISQKDSIISDLKSKDENNKTIIQQLQDEKKIMLDQRGIMQGAIDSLTKQLRKSKRATRWTRIGGSAALVAIGYLYFTK